MVGIPEGLRRLISVSLVNVGADALSRMTVSGTKLSVGAIH